MILQCRASQMRSVGLTLLMRRCPLNRVNLIDSTRHRQAVSLDRPRPRPRKKEIYLHCETASKSKRHRTGVSSLSSTFGRFSTEKPGDQSSVELSFLTDDICIHTLPSG
jgi:hypothetical protein